MIRTDIARRLFTISASIDRMGASDLADEMDRVARQMLLPMEMFPEAEYSDAALDFIPRDEVPEGVEDRGLYHVTSDYPGVTERGLLSREQLQMIGGKGQGLGGKVTFLERPGMVATTYSKDRAISIHDNMMTMARWLRGKGGSSGVIGPIIDAAGDHLLDENYDRFIRGVRGIVRGYGVDLKGIKLLESMDPAKDLGERIDGIELEPRERYEMAQEIENLLYQMIEDEYYGVDDPPVNPTSGFAAPFEAVQHLDPDKIRMLRLRARKGADVDHIPQEGQLNFRSWDLLPEGGELTPEEMALWQQTTYDPNL